MECTLYAVRVFVSDWQRAIDFYTDTLELGTVFRSDEMGWAQLATGATHLALERVSAGSDEADLVGRFVGVSLSVDDIEKTHRTLVEHGVEFTSPPERMDWGGVLAHFRDPEGNVLTLLGQPS